MSSAHPVADETYDKLGGWLILPAIIHPLYGIGQNLIATGETFGQYSDKLPFTSQVYIVVVALLCVAFALGWAAALYYACSISPIFPKLYIWLLIVTIVTGIAAIVTANAYFGAKASPDDYKDIAKTVAVAIIWIPYMLVSRRVKATFYGIPFPQKSPKTVASPLDLKGESRHLSPGPVDENQLRFKKKGNRLGIFLTLASIVLVIAGFLGSSGYEKHAWAEFFVAIGLVGTLFGYLFARLWYWFRAA